MGRTVGRLLLCLPPALAAGLFFLGGSSSGLEPDSKVQLASASHSGEERVHTNDGVLPPEFEHAWIADGPKYMGSASCAASNCHGGDSLKGIVGSEHSIWLQKDPHANAYDVLLNEQSRNMIKLLRQSPRYKELLANREAHQTRLCLDCHSVVPHVSKLAHGHKLSLRDGVSCEGCHGPAEKWLDPHKRPDWDAYTPEEKEKLFGFSNTDNLISRARICAECHIGSKDKEVNHDLMAAGHPRLTFEMSAYFDNLPPHWNPNEDRRQTAVNEAHQAAGHVRSTFDAKLWAVGQLAVAEKTAELLEKRASDPHKVWPEFTEYGCYACHHNLQPSNWRQDRGFANRRPGGFPWATWQFPVLAKMSPHLLEDLPNPFMQEDGVYQQLNAEMSRPIPNREKVAKLAGILKTQLHDLGNHVDGMSFSESQVQSLFKEISGQEGAPLVGYNWDAAAQVYLGTVALYQGLVDAQGRITNDGFHAPLTEEDKAVYDRFRAIRDLLKFSPESEDGKMPEIYNSPKTFEETAPNPVDGIKSQLDGINKAVK